MIAAIDPAVLPPVVHDLWFFFLVLFVDALAVPLASSVYVVYMGTQHPAPWVAAVGAAATTAGSVVQYLIVRWLLARAGRLPPLFVRVRARVENAVRTSSAATFGALFLIYATPLSAGPLRLIAAAGGFPLGQFALAIGLGCVPYYFVLSTLGRTLRLPVWAYAVVVGAVLLLGGAQVAARRARRRGPHTNGDT